MYPKVSILKTASGDFMVWSGADALGKLLLQEGIHEGSVIAASKYIASLIKGRPAHILDIGANIGSYAIPLARDLGSNVNVSCFEIQKPVFYQLCGNIFLNSFLLELSKQLGRQHSLTYASFIPLINLF